ncbi:MAG TPA: hypothetical protein VGJ44_11660 [Kribbellaceae bacterium]
MLTSAQVTFVLHLGLGVLLVHAYAGGLATLLRPVATAGARTVRLVSTAGLAAVAWITVVTGTWLVYPGYRAKPQPGADLVAYPRSALLADERTAVWHHFGMEWKEHVGWLVPFLATAVAYLVIRHRERVDRDPRLRRLVAALFVISLAASVVAAGLGAVINAVAPNQFLDH